MSNTDGYGSQPYGTNSNGTGSQPGQYGSQTAGEGQYGSQPYGQSQYGHGQPQYDQGQYGQQPYGAPAQSQQYGEPQYGNGYSQQYGAPQYQQTAYGQPQYGYAQGQYSGGMAGQNVPVLASWGSRVGAYLIDGLISLIPLAVIGGIGAWMAFKDTYTTDIGNGESELHGVNGSGLALMGLSWLISLIVQLWNRGIRQGQTGQSIGKKMLHLKVVDEMTGMPTGAGKGFGRFALEFVFGVISSFVGVLTLLDLLWPLWDNRNQSLHDKVVHTLVVRGD